LQLKIIKEIPEELLNCQLKDLQKILGGPTLIHLKGSEKKEPLFLSTLLHANETTSFLVLQKLLKEYQDKSPKRDLIIFIGNTIAAQIGIRHLENQPDFNRIWGTGDTPEHSLAKKVRDYACSYQLFANIDIHNNTGNNPFYACVNALGENYLKLASLFSKKVVFFTEPNEVQSMCFARYCPSVTIEAGVPGNKQATVEVYDYIQKVMNLDSFDQVEPSNDLTLFHTIGRIKIDRNTSVTFGDSGTENLVLREDIDSLNFDLISEGTVLGKINDKSKISVIDNQDKMVTSKFFKFDSAEIEVITAFYPAMLTKDVYVMKEDCLGYIMEEISL
jgi:succinylglutamate desuccinylase